MLRNGDGPAHCGYLEDRDSVSCMTQVTLAVEAFEARDRVM
jgi:hypothetical protein